MAFLPAEVEPVKTPFVPARCEHERGCRSQRVPTGRVAAHPRFRVYTLNPTSEKAKP